MNNLLVFASKEIMETKRTKRLFVLVCVFLLFAFTGPLLARFTAEFITLMMPAEEMAMLFIEIPPPVWQDGYAQFYGNLIQIGTIAIILLYMGSVLDERRKGTAALMMMKGLSRFNFITAKFLVGALVIFVVLAVSVVVAHLYTLILFGEAAAVGDMLLGGLVYYLFTLLMLSVTIICSTMAKSAGMAATFGLLSFMALSLIGLIRRVGDISPYVLAQRALEVTFGFYHEWLWLNIVLAIAVIKVLLYLSVCILKKKEL
jgi:ABC-2 type transport system permease protein